MKTNIIILLVVNLLIFQIGLISFFVKHKNSDKIEKLVNVIPPSQEEAKPDLFPIKNSIQNSQPSYLDYSKLIEQIKKWNEEAPEMTEVGTYGKSTKGQSLYYIRIANKRFIQTSERPKVLITACIHGNEPLAAATVMWYIGSLLKHYNDDADIRELLDSRDIYFIPVVNPDSYPKSRYVDGVDPNRDFPKGPNSNYKSIKSISELQEFFKIIKPQAVISAHTWGRVYLTPYGDSMEKSPDHDQFNQIMEKMSEMSGYRYMRACDLYKSNGGLNNPPIKTLGRDIGDYKVMTPIFGCEIDWYYRNKSFAIVMELGEHQRIPSDEEIKIEFAKTYQAVLYFIKEAPLVKLKIS